MLNNAIRKENGYWRKKENQRKFLESLSAKLQITDPSIFATLSKEDVKKHGGSSLLAVYQNSFKRALKSIFTDEWFCKTNYWSNKENQKAFFENFAKKFNIKHPIDWSLVSPKTFKSNGGITILKQYTSLHNALKSIYPKWKSEWFYSSSGYWSSMENQKFFMDELAVRFSIKNPKDWGKLSQKQLFNLGANSLLFYYKYSLQKALEAIYPDIEWKKEWFPKTQGYWMQMHHQRTLFDKIKIQLGISKASDWGGVTADEVIQRGAGTIMKTYKRSLWNALNAIYPGRKIELALNNDTEIIWKKEWFRKKIQFRRDFWNSKENERQFLDEVAIANGVTTVLDWRKVTTSLIRRSGGNGLLKKYSGSLSAVLRSHFPSENWIDIFNNSSQISLEGSLQRIFRKEVVVKSNYRKHK